MLTCPFDGYRVIEIGDNLYKCLFCDMRLTKKGSELVPYRNVVYPYDRDVRDRLTVEGLGRPREPEPVDEGIPFGTEMSQDMVVWVRRIAEGLVPVEGLGYRRDIRSKLLNTQSQIRKGLTDVLEGDADFQKWYDKTKTNFAKHDKEMMRILYDAAEGLEDPEVVELRNAYAKALQRGPMG